MKPLHRIICLVAVLTTGCDSGPRDSQQADAARIEQKLAASQREAEQFRDALSTETAEKSSMAREIYDLKVEIETLKKQADGDRAASALKIEQLSRELAAAKVSPTAADPSAPSPPAAVPAAADSVAALGKKVADIESRIAVLRRQVIQSRDKIGALIRSTVDQAMIVPPGGKVEEGQVYRYDNEPGSRPRYVCIGPAVRKGDFRSQHEKDKAVLAAKDEAMPLGRELKALEDQLPEAKAALAKARKAAGN